MWNEQKRIGALGKRATQVTGFKNLEQFINSLFGLNKISHSPQKISADEIDIGSKGFFPCTFIIWDIPEANFFSF